MLAPHDTTLASLAAIKRCLSSRRFRLSSERELQRDIAKALADCGIACERERRLSAEDRPDFLAGGIAIEVKIAGGRLEIYRQCRRYCAHAEVSALVLATNVAMALPPMIDGKPTTVIHLGRAWL
jgi:hypothetical protein